VSTRRLSELTNLEGRVALVTGAAGHIGRVLVEALAELGASVAVLDLDPRACGALAEAVAREYGVDSLPLVVDLVDEAQVRAAPGTVVDRFGRLDILVNCAAMVNTADLTGWIAPFVEQGVEAWRLAVETNLTAPFLLTQACVGPLRKSGHGSIINVGSMYGIVGPDMRLYDGTAMGNAAAYAASKGGLLQLTRWLATVLAPEIRVNAISPGGIWRDQPDEFSRRFRARTPLGRMGTEEDVKGALAYLATDLSAYVTGQNVVVDGGFTTW
jgi:NAD(P)-dependent dehydrogenase (short-subunit alcohol dehydrogenase family)